MAKALPKSQTEILEKEDLPFKIHHFSAPTQHEKDDEEYLPRKFHTDQHFKERSHTLRQCEFDEQEDDTDNLACSDMKRTYSESFCFELITPQKQPSSFFYRNMADGVREEPNEQSDHASDEDDLDVDLSVHRKNEKEPTLVSRYNENRTKI